MPDPRPVLCLLGALCLPGFAAAQETMTLSTTCLGAHRDVALQPTGFLDLDGETTSFGFGPAVQVCVLPEAVTLYGAGEVTLGCADIRDSAAEGMGYDFTPDGTAHHLWFHIAPARSPQVLEIGLYRDGVELVWIDTGVPICNR
jgi:hypothetical protein